MIRALLYDKTADIVTTGGRELYETWQETPESILWFDIEDEPTTAESALLQDSFGLHPLAIQDAQRTRHPPKLEAYDTTTFILMKGLSTDAHGLQFSTIQLAIFIGDRFMVTRRTGTSTCTDALYETAASDTKVFAKGSAGLAIRLARLQGDRYLKIMLALEPRLEEIEDEILDNPDDKLLGELLKHRTELKKFRRLFIYQQQIFQELKPGYFPVFDESLQHEIIDAYEQLERVSSLATLYHDLASDLAEGYISVASHHLNQIMKILTVVMSIFVPLSFLAGIYGMNFENMPELHSRAGYFILLGIMFTIALILVTIFRRMRWL